jgi:hypothetical protein
MKSLLGLIRNTQERHHLPSYPPDLFWRQDLHLLHLIPDGLD